MIYRQPVKHRAWYDTKLCREWEFKEASARVINHIVLVRANKRTPANDRDHIRW